MRPNLQRKRQTIFLLMTLGLLAVSGLFLWLEHVTHYEFLLHVAAIPLEILVGAFLVERWLAHNEKVGKLQQLSSKLRGGKLSAGRTSATCDLADGLVNS